MAIFRSDGRDGQSRRSILRLLTLAVADCFMPFCGLKKAVSSVDAAAAEPRFDVVSIRPSAPGGGEGIAFGHGPDGYSTRNQSMWATIMVAYYPFPNRYWPGRLIGGPKWLSDRYDINAKVALEDLKAWRNQGGKNKMLKSMLQAALQERCHLVLYTTTIESPIYQLVVAKHGLKGMAPTKNGPMPPDSFRFSELDGNLLYTPGEMHYFGTSMESIANMLTVPTDLPVFDATGLPGLYDFTVSKSVNEEGSAGIDDLPFRLADLGLELKRTKGPILTFVIDHIERPTPN